MCVWDRVSESKYNSFVLNYDNNKHLIQRYTCGDKVILQLYNTVKV